MASITTQTDAVRDAVASIQTCTPTISATLKELLQSSRENEANEAKPPTKSRPAKVTQATKGKPTASTKRGAAAQAVQQGGKQDGGLSAKEKAVLATQVINATLKSLGDAAKRPPAPRSPAPGQQTKSTSRTALRRSNSVPLSPFKPRSLNRVSTSPGTCLKILRSPSLPTASSGCLATVECARVAFSALRALSNAGKVLLPELQLESGMSSFVNKLIALNLYEQALKELRLLKRRLDTIATGNNNTKTKPATTTEAGLSSKTLSDLFEYPDVKFDGPVLGLIVTSQLQALRILHGSKKLSHLDATIPFLRASHHSSPLSLLLLTSKGENADRAKCARQLESLAQCLLSLTPSLSTNEDGIAVESRLSPSPETALEIQALALTTRLYSWSLSGHKGDVDKDIMFPLSRCLATFARRSSSGASKSTIISEAFGQVWQRIKALGLKPSESSKSPLISTYQVLGTVSREAGNIKEATRWLRKLKAITTPKDDSAARCCSITAQLLALSLKQPTKIDESLIAEVLDGLQGTLSGNTIELDDLLISICLVRKAAITVVLEKQPSGQTDSTQELLESLLLQLPRFALRWLGKPPPSSISTKDALRFEQRRQLLARYIHHILDSALMLTKILLDRGKLPFDLMDPVLQDSLMVIENMGDLALLNIKDNAAVSYHVKISHFYYQQHLILRQAPGPKDVQHLRALRRSVDAVKLRSTVEQAKAQLLTKQERLAELYRASGRRDDAADVLRSIRDTIVRDDIVTNITEALSNQSLWQVWKSNAKNEALSRAVCNLAKVDCIPCDWTWLLTGADKATALEHDLYFVYSSDAKNRKQLSPGETLVDSLLQAFDVDGHPIRRLRTLLQLLTVKIDSRDDHNGWLEEARNLSESLREDHLMNDSCLGRYIPHLQALTACAVALFSSQPYSSSVIQAIATWKAMVGKSHSPSDLYQHIDNPHQLVEYLQSLADFAKMKGFNTLLGSTLELSADILQITGGTNPELLLSQNTALCLQHLTIGHSSKVEKILGFCREYIARQELPLEAVANFYLCSAEYNMVTGNFYQAEQNLAEAQASVTAQADKHSRSSRLHRKISIAYASFLHSVLALERGNSHHALNYAKNAVRILFQDWAKLETLRGSFEDNGDEPLQVDTSEDDASFTSVRSKQSDITRANTGPEFWAMVHPLFRFILRLSSIYAHVGMYQETMYYAEQAQKVADSMESLAYISQSKAWLASVSMTAGKSEQALDLATEVKKALSKLEPTCSTIDMTCQLSLVFQHLNDHDTGLSLMGMADAMLQKLNGSTTNPDVVTHELETKMEKLTIKDKTALKTTVRQTKAKTTKTTRVAGKASTKKVVTARATTPVMMNPPSEPEDLQLSFLRASVLQHQSMSLVEKRDWTAAITALTTACELSKLSTDLAQERLFMAVALVGQSMEQMGRDSVFSVIQDSTLSFPAIAGSLKDKSASDRLSVTKTTPPRKGRAALPSGPSFLENLRQAQDYLLEAHSAASINGDGRLVQRIASLLQNVFILLSTTSPSKSSVGHPAHATCSIELARNLTWRRECKTLRFDDAKTGKAEWPILKQATDPRRSSLGCFIDMNRFQKEYVDIIPKSWNVVSLSLSDNKNDLCITKLQAGHSPFAIRLPLERASSRDADTEVFNFLQGRTELLDIIEVINRTCHDARDMSAKGAKSAWWAERQALDDRMKDLLENIEQTWLGGFRGIFSQHHRRSELLARFQKSFQNILDKHLPSRRQVRNKRTKAAGGAKVSLDPRILDLFIGLGDVSASECDLDDLLTDLLYFVVDILQFHGERNAYDEIDFDSMVVETIDALHSYHAAAKSCKDVEDGVHTILVLDKALHVFPWESLPCMQGLAVSRIPSLACLRRSILEQNSPHPKRLHDDEESGIAAAREGHYISTNSGTYILNPGADLKSTQSTFGKPLASLPPAWSSIETRAPSEAEFETALTNSDLLLYFGHGSGAQYIRGRTIRKLEKCRAVALLMGCSSASLADVGDFECHGPVWNYMLAGSPAVAGTLWDVTDRDIDRYAGRVFEEWGLMPRGTFAEDGAKGKGKAVAAGRGRKKEKRDMGEEDEARPKTSLVEAVANARDVCKFRYLTAAAVVVYGIPVYIEK